MVHFLLIARVIGSTSSACERRPRRLRYTLTRPSCVRDVSSRYSSSKVTRITDHQDNY